MVSSPQTSTCLAAIRGHQDRVNCVRWISARDCNDPAAAAELVSSSSDKTLKHWKKKDGEWKCGQTLAGHDGSVTTFCMTSVKDKGLRLAASLATDATLIVWRSQEKTASGDFDDWVRVQDISYPPKKIPVSIDMVHSPSGFMLAVGHVDSTVRLLGDDGQGFQELCTFKGHEDWITALAFHIDHGKQFPLHLATASADSNIRIWAIDKGKDPEAFEMRQEETTEVKDADGVVRRPKQALNLTVKHHNFSLAGQTLHAKLDAVLFGHEDRVHSVRWKPRWVEEVAPCWGGLPDGLVLLSSSMDKSMCVWAPDPQDDVWTSQVRVGDIGGQPGQLGYYGCLFARFSWGADVPPVVGISAHGHNGAFFSWCPPSSISSQQDDSALLGAWTPKVMAAGHYNVVEDIAWEPRGHYFLSASRDQTTRLWAEWQEGEEAKERLGLIASVAEKVLPPTIRRENFGRFIEIARPQVHGFGMKCVAFIGGRCHCYVCGADDEKVLRLFNAPKTFVESVANLCGPQAAVDHDEQTRVLSASLPALGLSNKPVASDSGSTPDASSLTLAGGEAEDMNVPEEQEEEFMPVQKARAISSAPTEEELLQLTLWPEDAKLYGHGNPSYAVAASNQGCIIAATCRAAESQQGQSGIRLWEAPGWKPRGVLNGHKLTVTQLRFSPDDSLLLSVSRDRSICIFARSTSELGTSFSLRAKLEKAHERIVWACSWDRSGRYFATGSRDKTVKVWELCGDGSQVNLVAQLPKFDSAVTALDWAPYSVSERSCIAIGTEEGEVSVWTSDPVNKEWEKLTSLQGEFAHAGAVHALRWRPTNATSVQLATCGEDHSVRVHELQQE
uniref:Elongator complex protein 2 n=1 Tax=Guillardia theta TaxID=55529 RepID=A0A7S4NR91_GUITH